MFRALSVIAAVAALAVSAAPVSSAVTSKKPTRPSVVVLIGYNDYPRDGARLPASARVNQQDITLVHEGFSIDVVAKPKPRGVIGLQPNGGLAHRDRKAKAPRPGIRNSTLDVATSEVFVANHTEGTIRGVVGGRYGDGRFGGR